MFKMESLVYCSDQQRDIVLSEHTRVLINGCAGSQKTGTIVKMVFKQLLRKKNVLILTLVSSVTVEIRDRLQDLLGIKFEKIGNHYFNDFGSHAIEIANYDAMIHKQLLVCNDSAMTIQYGDCFEEKCNVFYEKYVVPGSHTSFYMMNNAKAEVLVMDEFQDIEPVKARILTDIINSSPMEMIAIAAGDYLQTIFDHAIQPDDDHPMEIWKKELNPHSYTLNKCFRCPKSHVMFVNALMHTYYKQYEISPMEPTNEDIDHEPVIMLCPPYTNNKLSSIIAMQVRNTISELLLIDNDIKPKDIAIIMSRTNGNHVFKQLEFELSKLYFERFGTTDAIKIFETRGDGYTMSIDWNKAENKTVMLSIHGDKGKGHKVVFFLGFSENCIPKATRLFTDKSLVDESLANVALTRSTRWLFVGVTQHNPSRYIRDIACNLSELCVLSWDENTWNRPWHKRVCDAVNDNIWTQTLGRPFPLYIEEFYMKDKINAPDKCKMRVKDDIAQAYEHPKKLVASYPWKDATVVKFGNRVVNLSRLNDEQLPYFGNMGELIFQHYHYYRNGGQHAEYDFLLKPSRVFYTDDQNLLNLVQDVDMNRHILSDLTGLHYHSIISSLMNDPQVISSPQLQKTLNFLATSRPPLFVVPSILKDETILDHVRLFLAKNICTDQIPSNVFWAMAIIQDIVYSPLRNPMIFKEFGAFNQDISALVQNIKLFYNSLHNREEIVFHRPYSLVTVENNPTILADMGIMERNSVSLGIIGVSDFDIGGEIFEIKNPIGYKYNNKWVLQPLMYSCLSSSPIHTIHVVDFMNGEWRKFLNMNTINKKYVVKKVLTKFAHRPDHINALLTKVGK